MIDEFDLRDKLLVGRPHICDRTAHLLRPTTLLTVKRVGPRRSNHKQVQPVYFQVALPPPFRRGATTPNGTINFFTFRLSCRNSRSASA